MADFSRLILASASPRRQELLKKLNIPFEIETSDVDEQVPEGTTAADTAQYLAALKAQAVFSKHKDEQITVIGSDTIVVLDNVIFGKPKDKADAFRMLRALSGRTHEVMTGVAIICQGKRISFTSVTKVKFYELEDSEINAYIESGEPMDKAGAYGIQDHGALLIEGIEGDYYTVVGFPIAEVGRTLRKIGF